MALVIPSASEKTLADFMLGVTTPGNQTLKLFVNNVTPDDATVAATLTEMSTHGYAAKTLTKTSWATVAGAVGIFEGGVYTARLRFRLRRTDHADLYAVTSADRPTDNMYLLDRRQILTVKPSIPRPCPPAPAANSQA